MEETRQMDRILIIVDAQNDFIDGALANEAAQAVVPRIVGKIKSWKGNGFIIVTQDTHTASYLTTLEGKHLPVEHCVMGTKGWEIHESILNALNDPESGHWDSIRKNAFGSMKLVEVINRINQFDLKFKGIRSIELCGFCTDICVISNALMIKSLFPEIPVVVHADLCAGVTPELHDAALKVMRSCQITIMENGLPV